jgi:hypothetical protein
MIVCVRATRGLRRPSLDARRGRSISPIPGYATSEPGRIICINCSFDLGCASSRDPPLFPFSLLARLEGMWTEAFDMASASKGSSLYTPHLTQDRCAILSTIAAIRGPFNRTAAARRRRSGIDVRRSVHALHGTERVSMPSSGEIRTVELTRGRETGAAILSTFRGTSCIFSRCRRGRGRCGRPCRRCAEPSEERLVLPRD